MQVTRPMTDEIHGHTGLRGIAASCVFIYHLHWEAWFPGWFGYGISKMVAWPGLAVDLFFILSGFILCHVYVFRRMAGWKNYLGARFARIFPLSVAVVLFCVGLDLYSYSRYGIWSSNLGGVRILANLLSVQAWDGDAIANSINPPSWSISVECFLYLFVFPPLFYGFRGEGFLSNWKKIAICLALASVAACLTSGANFAHQALVRGASGFAVGFFIRHLIPHIRMSDHRINWLGTLCAVILLIVPATGTKLHGMELLLAGGLVMAAAHNTSWPGKIFGLAPLKWLGERSYSIYLIHHPLIVVAFRLVLYPNHTAGGYPLMIVILTHALILVGTLVGAAISYRWFEIPMRDFLRRLISPRIPKCSSSVVNSIS